MGLGLWIREQRVGTSAGKWCKRAREAAARLAAAGEPPAAGRPHTQFQRRTTPRTAARQHLTPGLAAAAGFLAAGLNLDRALDTT